MIRIKAVNDVIIIRKDRSVLSDLVLPESSNDMYQIPEPYTGVIDSVGFDNEWKEGDRVAFCDIGGVYIKIDDVEYVIITPEMIIGKF